MQDYIRTYAQLQKRARSLSLPTTGSSSSTPTSSPSPTPLSNSMPPTTLGLLLRKKRTSNAFDINNIVIPYSMASSTRVEKLQYKEIPTPSWRLLEVEPSSKPSDAQHDEKVDIENLEEDIFIERHEICEEHERKRFLGFLTKKRKRTQRQSSELGNPDDTPNTPPGHGMKKECEECDRIGQECLFQGFDWLKTGAMIEEEGPDND
ncbi:hypothetical protein QZH41_007073 [Actinostola sp. cb2023]|nr:hypothetical protein QZH41_007073 [Actinostola sp. cb2023]